jgi:hypothetical protein
VTGGSVCRSRASRGWLGGSLRGKKNDPNPALSRYYTRINSRKQKVNDLWPVPVAAVQQTRQLIATYSRFYAFFAA